MSRDVIQVFSGVGIYYYVNKMNFISTNFVELDASSVMSKFRLQRISRSIDMRLIEYSQDNSIFTMQMHMQHIILDTFTEAWVL